MSSDTPGNGRASICWPVFAPAAITLVALLGFSTLKPDTAKLVFGRWLSSVTANFGWLYVLAVAGFIGIACWLIFSRHGSIRLGPDDARPDFPTLTWLTMLFSAGMGIGLVYFSVAEPIMHYVKPPSGAGGTLEARRGAIALTLFHWGVHAWAIYVVMGVCIAYFSHRKGLPLSIRSCLHPVLGDRIHGFAGHFVDALAALATIFGLATSLGLGSMQISAGLAHLFGTPHTLTTQLMLIAVITLLATVSLVSGLDKGIRRLSELNVVLALSLVAIVFLAGPTLRILESTVQGLGAYGRVVAAHTFKIGAHDTATRDWSNTWTLFYWGWWIAWAPFVGIFIARISRGRTIRELVFGALIVPTLVAWLWFGVFGGTALHLEDTQGGIASAVAADSSTAIYVMLAKLPLGVVTTTLATVVVAVFFVTSSDSASLVVDMLASGGHPNPPTWQRVFWACAEGTSAAVLLYVGGKNALLGLQSASVSIGLPFCIVLIVCIYCLVKALRSDSGAASPRPG